MLQPQRLTLADRCRNVELLILDVDGVLTRGEIIYGEHEDELKIFHVRDGTALKYWRLAGKQAAIISGRNSQSVERRASELGIEVVLQGKRDKVEAYHDVIER